MTSFVRSFPLRDIAIRSGGDGRTVEAYAAVFDTPTEIRDAQGHYFEQIDRASFNRTVSQRGTRFGVFYNHAMTLQGTPSEMASVPLGSPVEAPRADGHGLVTVTRYNRTPLADQVLEAIRNGDITGQSFSGRWVRSEPGMERGCKTYRPKRDGSLVTVSRMEIAMTEYGPTPMPAYDVPMVLGVRSLAARIAGLSPAERAEIVAMLSVAVSVGDDGPEDSACCDCCSPDCADGACCQDPAACAGDCCTTAAADAAASATTSADGSSSGRSSTGTTPPAAEDPRQGAHSGRLTVAQRVRAGMVARGIAR